MNFISKFLKFWISKNGILLSVFTISILGLYFWSTNFTGYNYTNALYLASAPLASLLFIVLCSTLFLEINFNSTSKLKKYSKFVFLIVILLNINVLFNSIFSLSWDIESVFSNNSATFNQNSKDKIIPFTAFLFISISIAFWNMRNYTSRILKTLSDIISSMVFVTSFIFIVGYIYKSPLILERQMMQVALFTAICFMLLSILFFRINGLPLGLSKNKSIRVLLLKSFLPIVVIIIILQGLLGTIIYINTHNPTLISIGLLFLGVILSVLFVNHNSKNIAAQLSYNEKLLTEKNKEIEAQNIAYKQINEELFYTKERIEQYEMRFKSLVENIHDMITIFNLSGEIMYISPAVERRIGYSLSELQLLPRFRWIHPDAIEETDKIIKLAIANPELPFQTTTKIHCKDGTRFWAEGNIINMLNNKNIKGIVCNFRDITKRIKKEETIMQYTSRLETAEEHANLGSWEFDVITQKAWWSKQMYLMNGFEIAMNPPDFEEYINHVHIDDREKIREVFQKIKHGEFPRVFEFRNNLYNDKMQYFTFTYCGETDSNGNIIKLLGTQQDITKRRIDEMALLETERFSKATLDALSTNIAVLNQKGEIIFVNKAWRSFGIANSISDPKVHLNDNYLTICDNVAKNSVDYEYALSTANGIRSLLNGEKISFEMEYPCDTLKEKLWFQLHATRFEGEGPIYLTVSHENITERKKAEISLRESEKKFVSIFDTSPVGICLSNPETETIINVNNSFATIWGYSKSEMIGKTISELNLWCDITQKNQLYVDLKTYGGVKNRIIDGRRKNDAQILLQVSVDAIQLNHEKFILSNIEDITQRKLIENEIIELNQTLESKVIGRTTELEEINHRLIKEIDVRKQAEQRFEHVVESVPNSIILIDSRGIIQFANIQTEHYFGYKISELIGQKIEMLVPDEYLTNHLEKRKDYSLNPVARNIKSLPVIYGVRKNGERIPLDIGLNPLVFNNEVFILTSILDISERLKSEEKLKQSATRLELATRAGGVGVWEYDVANNLLDWDYQMCALYGITKEQFNNDYQSWQDTLHPDDLEHTDAAIQQALLGENEFTNEFRVIWQDGSVHYIRAHGLVQRNAKGEAVKMIGTNWDITEQINSANTIYEAKQLADASNRMKSEFIANMSHEIRTPLNAIVGFSTILKEKTEGNKTFTEYLGNIIKSSRVLLNLINDILDLSKIEAGRMVIDYQSVNLFNLLKEVQDIFQIKATEKGIHISIEIANDIPEYLIIDEKYLRQILFNIIGNAVKFTNIGEVIIKVNLISGNEQNGKIDMLISVRDTGIGIPDNEIGTIFEPFTQVMHKNKNKYGGTGLGLSITNRLVELLGGNILAESELGKGSVFCVSLFNIEVGVCNKNESTFGHKNWLKTIRFNNPYILIAEDETTNRQIIKGYLESLNTIIIEADNGEDCIKAVYKYQPDIILMDMQMPVMDGFTAISTLKMDAKFKDIPIIALTAWGMKHEKDKINSVADDFLLKPVYKYDLVELLTKYLPYTQLSDNENHSIDSENSKLESSKNELSVELKKELKEQFLNEIMQLQETLNIDKIKIFAAKLQKIGTQIENTEITNYYNLLSDYINSFNMDKVSLLLAQFAEYLK